MYEVEAPLSKTLENVVRASEKIEQIKNKQKALNRNGKRKPTAKSSSDLHMHISNTHGHVHMCMHVHVCAHTCTQTPHICTNNNDE